LNGLGRIGKLGAAALLEQASRCLYQRHRRDPEMQRIWLEFDSVHGRGLRAFQRGRTARIPPSIVTRIRDQHQVDQGLPLAAVGDGGDRLHRRFKTRGAKLAPYFEGGC